MRKVSVHVSAKSTYRNRPQVSRKIPSTNHYMCGLNHIFFSTNLKARHFLNGWKADLVHWRNKYETVNSKLCSLVGAVLDWYIFSDLYMWIKKVWNPSFHFLSYLYCCYGQDKLSRCSKLSKIVKMSKLT